MFYWTFWSQWMLRLSCLFFFGGERDWYGLGRSDGNMMEPVCWRVWKWHHAGQPPIYGTKLETHNFGTTSTWWNGEGSGMCKSFSFVGGRPGEAGNLPSTDCLMQKTETPCWVVLNPAISWHAKNIHQNDGAFLFVPICIEVPCNSATEISLVVAIPCGSVGTSWSRIRHPKLPGFGVWPPPKNGMSSPGAQHQLGLENYDLSAAPTFHIKSNETVVSRLLLYVWPQDTERFQPSTFWIL